MTILIEVASFAEAWIEKSLIRRANGYDYVASFAEAWIEKFETLL